MENKRKVIKNLLHVVREKREDLKMKRRIENQEIIWTKDYNDFRFIEYNRHKIDWKHINSKIIPSLKKHGWLPHNPMVVDGNLVIRDGQHRFHAAKELGIEIPVLIVDNYNDDILLDLNNSSKKWTEVDKIHMHALVHNEPGNIKIIELYEKYNLDIRTILRAANRRRCGKDDTYNVIKDFNKTDVENKLNKIIELETSIGIKNCNLRQAIINLLENKKYNQNHLLKKINNFRDRIYRCSNTSGFLKMLIDLYNYKAQSSLRLKLEEFEL